MPFDAAQLTAFWTSPDQMGHSARTRTQMASEGLVTPADFEDFSEKSDLDALVKLLLKPAKVRHGAAGNLREVESYAIPAKSQIRIDGARKMVLYYILVGRPMEAADMMWPVIKNFVEQWKALMEKKKADIGLPPKLTKDKLVYKWLEQLNQYLADVIGVRNAPFTYLTRTDAQPPAILAARIVDQPYSVDYESIEHELKFCVSHDHTLSKSDNSALFQIIDRAVAGHDVSATIAPFRRTHDGRGAYLAILTQHAGKSVWDRVVRDAMLVLQTRTWSGTTSVTLLQHTSMQRKAFIQLSEADNPKMLAGTAAIEQDELGKRVHFENTVTFLLPFDPVVAKNAKAKGLGVNVSGTAADTPAKGATVGKTGVELRWHEPQKFSKLTKEQKLELSEWNKTQPKREGGKKRTSEKSKSTDKWKKARVASVLSKANKELMEAMADSHSADMAVMNARIAGMIAAIPPAAGVATGRVGATVGFHPGLQGPPPSFIPESIDVMAERARVASVNLKNILKPPSKQAAP